MMQDCVYADLSKNKQRQPHVVAATASHPKGISSEIPLAEVVETHAIDETVREAS